MLYNQVSPASSWRQILNIYNQAGKGSCTCSQRPERNWHIHRCMEQKRNKSSRIMKAMNPGGWKWLREWKWRQKSDSWSKQLNSLTIIQDDAMGITQTSNGCVWFLQLFTFWTSKGLSAIMTHQLRTFLLEHLFCNIQATCSRTPFGLSCFILGCNLSWRQRSLSRVECSLKWWIYDQLWQE